MKKLFLVLAAGMVLSTGRAASPALKISEFMALNEQTVQDADGDYSPWIEIYNPTSGSVSMSGWALTDDTNNLRQWRFPDVTLLDAGDANQSDNFMVVFASGKDRTNNIAELHTNFRLPSEGGFLALVDPGTNIVAVFNGYPSQRADVSYGLDASDSTVQGYFANPTPGKPNSMGGETAAPGTTFSQVGGMFSAPFSLVLSSGSGAAIYYTTNGSVPTQNSLLYQNPISIDGSKQVRARAYVAGLMPGAIHSETYLQLNDALATTNSSLPAIVIYNFAAGDVQEATDQFANISIYEPQNGVTSLTNAPTLTVRAGIHLHGSSTLTSPKKSFAVEFWDELNNDLDCAPLGFPAESDFILYGPDSYEPVLMHNPLMYKISNEIGRYASRTRFVEVYLNTGGGPLTAGNYNGIYVLEEKIKWDPNRVNISKAGSVDALHPLDNTEPDVTGGYIAKVDRLDAGERGFVADGQINSYDYPQETEMNTPQRAPQKQYLQNFMNSFSNAVNGSNFTEPDLGYRPFVDVPSWIDYHILNVVAFNEDTLALSAYYYKDRNDVLHYGPIWDFDRSQGSKAIYDFNPSVWGQPPTDMFRKYWWGRIFSDPDFWQAWIDRYQDLRETTLATNHVYELIDGFAAEVGPQDDRESARWPDNSPRLGSYSYFGYGYNFPGTYQGEVDFLKQWYADRFNFLDTNFLARPGLSISNGLFQAGDALELTAPPGATIYFTLDNSDPRLAGGGISPAALVYESPIPLEAGVTLKARAYDPQHFNLTGVDNPVLSSPWSGLANETFNEASAPVVLQDPISLDAYAGQSPTFTVDAEWGTPASVIQWSLNGFDLPGETNAQLTVNISQTNQSGVYLATLTNLAGTASASFTLNITPKPHLVVTEVMSSEAKKEPGSPATSDWWELSNLGNFTVNLYGFRFDDDHDSFLDAFTVTNAVTIAPGESVVFVQDMQPTDFWVWWGEEHLPPKLQIITYPSIGFSASGDAIHLWNAAANSVTDSVADVTFPAATKGVSFGYDVASRKFGGLSAVGVNGSYVAALNGDIGSPGTMGPTPYILGIERTIDSFNVLFSTIPGLDYEIDYKDSLSDANWIPWNGFLSFSNNFLLRDEQVSTNGSRFYRIQQVPGT